jgi:hypothetical protein
VVALGLALSLTVAVLDVAAGGGVGVLFDLAFVGVCVAVAMLVRPEDFFTAGVLPPLLMLTVLALVALWRPVAIAAGDHGVLSVLVTGLAHHVVALGLGYTGCLVCLAIRDQVVRGRRAR